MSDSSDPARTHRATVERRRKILQALRARGSISVDEVSREFRVSAMTARRDLKALAAEGPALRTRGGAMLPDFTANERSFNARLERASEGKLRIAKAVAATLQPRETLFIDSSSSAYYVLREILTARIAVTVITNLLPAMTSTARMAAPGVKLIGLGGSFHELGCCFVGSDTVRTIRSVYVDRLVLSVTAIDNNGLLTDVDPLEADVKRAMLGRARAVALVAAGDKFTHGALNVIAHANEIDSAYVADPPSAGVEMLERAGVTIVRV